MIIPKINEQKNIQIAAQLYERTINLRHSIPKKASSQTPMTCSQAQFMANLYAFLHSKKIK